MTGLWIFLGSVLGVVGLLVGFAVGERQSRQQRRDIESSFRDRLSRALAREGRRELAANGPLDLAGAAWVVERVAAGLDDAPATRARLVAVVSELRFIDDALQRRVPWT